MRAWRIKFVILLITYFAGFTTAVCMLNSESETPISNPSDNMIMPDMPEKKDVTETINAGIKKCVEFSLDMARQTRDIITEELHKHQTTSSSGSES